MQTSVDLFRSRASKNNSVTADLSKGEVASFGRKPSTPLINTANRYDKRKRTVTSKSMQEDYMKRAAVNLKQMNTDLFLVKSLEPFAHRTKKEDIVTMKAIERWLNDTLQDSIKNEGAAVADMPFLKEVQPLTSLGLDRLSLTKLGISQESTDRIYCTLRTNSLGFFDLLSQTTEGAGGRRTALLSRIWKVYYALLEHCCESDF